MDERKHEPSQQQQNSQLETEFLAQESRLLHGRYVVGKRIGAGGMGTILEAYDNQMDRQVALKVLHIHLAKDEVMRKRFAKEATNAATLSHPNIVAVYDQGCEDLPWIIMELVDGPSLREVLINNGPLEPLQVLSVISPLAEAIGRAHAKGLVHRDIKPENVLITKDGIPKLADFGIAKLIEHTSQTDMRTLVGSVHYLAPELVQGYVATSESDQYALAVMLFELLTGRKPLPADTPMAIALRHANEQIPMPSLYNPDVSRKLDAVVKTATARNPMDRYPSLHHFRKALIQAIPGESQPVIMTAKHGGNVTLILSAEEQSTLNLQDQDEGAVIRKVAHNQQKVRDSRVTWLQRVTSRKVVANIRFVALMVFVLSLSWYVWTTMIYPASPMGNYVGMPQEVAKQHITHQGQRVEVTAVSHPDFPAGVVVAQRPLPRENVYPNQVVVLEIARGGYTFDMPPLVGQHVKTALTALQAFGVQPAIVQEKSVQPPGFVVAQSVDAGTTISSQDAITLTISQGEGIELDIDPHAVDLPE